MDSQGTTLWLRGMAITVVLVGHYCYRYVDAAQKDWFYDFGIEAIAVFFVLSGYGIFLSLRRRLTRSGSTALSLLNFYAKRVVRIYPLYWLALLATPFFVPDPVYAPLHEFSFHTVAIYLALPFVRPPGQFWFIAAIVQCYLLTPILYLFVKYFRRGNDALFILICSVAALALLTYYSSIWADMTGWSWFNVLIDPAFDYRRIFLENVLFFTAGMLIAPLIEAHSGRLRDKRVMMFTVAAFAIFFYIDGNAAYFLSNNPSLGSAYVFIEPAYLFITVAFCLVLIAGSPVLPLGRFFRFLGSNSYMIYLFHVSFFGLLLKVGLIDGGMRGVFATVALLPLFFGACALASQIFHRVRSSIPGTGDGPLAGIPNDSLLTGILPEEQESG